MKTLSFNPLSWWRWWRGLAQNPIYLREKGAWGNPNPFYETLKRYSPFVIMGAIVLGACTGFSNPALLSGNETMLAMYCLVCLPAVFVGMLTLYGTFMAPALTAPLVSMEMNRSTWDILRVTPQSTQSILLAKLFGSLARLRIWWVLFGLSIVQGLVITCGFSLAGDSMAIWGWLMGLATALRPWVEIVFAAFIGMYLSTVVKSATISLVGAYTAVLFFKLFNNSLLWAGVFTLSAWEDASTVFSSVGPTAVYSLGIAILWFGINRQAVKMGSGE